MAIYFILLGVLFAGDSPAGCPGGVRRIYVDKLSGANSERIRDLVIASLQATGRFVMTENQERADAYLRGTASDEVFTESRQSDDGINARISRGTMGSGSNRLPSSGITIGDRESLRTTERRHEAVASLRLVDKDGDVIWSTTQESRGAKFRGASADLADKVAQRLIEDCGKIVRPSPPPVSP
ncbi:MAG: hypothetical protein JNK87_27290 [Bryobacterales bacterium]|nr:hypothetical protein [Bryobacterales bacterium]